MATHDDTTFPTSSPSMGTGTTGGSPMGASSTLGAIDDEADLTRPGAPRTGGDEMLARVVQGAHQTIDRLAETAAPHVHRLSEGVQSGTGHVREVSEEWTESLRTTVRENPLAAVATALAVGMLIARITR